MIRGIVATIVAVAVLAVGLVLVNNGAFNPPTAPPSTPPSSSPTAIPTRIPASSPTPRPSASPIDTSVVASGMVVPLRSAELAARVSGVVAALYVRDGSEAEANQLLLKLDQRTYQAQADFAEASVDSALAAVEQAQLQVNQLPPDASPGQVEFVQANLRLAEAELEVARTSLSSAAAALLQTEVRAPFAGTIADVAIEVGEQAIAGQTVITIGDITGWLIETTDVSELEVVRLAVGDRASVSFEALPGLVINGTVDRIQVRGTTADGGVVYAVAIRPDAHSDRLRWGMTATVRITPSG
ncbi:MAG: efflux RND transporter periplasmic adaptor subunit [Candidatus Limnocylindrales bacterium]